MIIYPNPTARMKTKCSTFCKQVVTQITQILAKAVLNLTYDMIQNIQTVLCQEIYLKILLTVKKGFDLG